MSQSDGYRLIQQLGAGLSGDVFLAEAPSGQVALKQFRSRAQPKSAESIAVQQHFLIGASRWKSLTHPRIVPVLDLIDEGAETYVAMEYVPSETLEAYLGKQTLSPEQANYVLRLLATGLDYAHQKGVTHGDLKPSNVFVLPKLAVKVSDFALSPRAQQLPLKPLSGDAIHPYLSPEHLRAPHTIGPRSDQYALALLAYRLYTGETPFQRSPDLSPAILRGVQVPPSGLRPKSPAACDSVILKALSVNPGDRYGSCMEFVDSLEAGLSQKAAGVPIAGKSFPLLLYAGIASLLAALGIAAFLLWPAKPAKVVAANTAPVVSAPVPVAPQTVPATPLQVDPPKAKPQPAVVLPPAVVAAAQPPHQPAPRIEAKVPPSDPVPLDASAAQARGFDIVLSSRTTLLEPGSTFSVKDSTLGEMGHGDLKAFVKVYGAVPKGTLTLEWTVDGVPMDTRTVAANRNAEYNNEPTPGAYQVTLSLDRKKVKTVGFRITP